MDGSNDSGLKKINPLTVHLFTPDGVTTQLLDMCTTRGASAADILGKLMRPFSIMVYLGKIVSVLE